MAPKRTFEFVANSDEKVLDAVNDDGEPPAKRRFTLPQTPQSQRASSSTSVQTPFTSTPLPSRPFDSPTNPLGRKHTRTLIHSLPAPTKFTRHLPLRFQFVRPGVSPRMGGIYRIVQVPLSYTFVHLRRLIAFLFGDGFGDEREDRHLFEVKKKVSLYSLTYKPGQIKEGITAFKLSTARDPCRYKPELEEDALEDDEIIEDNPQANSDADEVAEEEPAWTWELEESFTLGNVWSRGLDLGLGIIYHHNETTAIHITINVQTEVVPKRRGRSNTPYVFIARGRVRLYPDSFLPLPKPVFSVPVRNLSLPTYRKPEWSTSSNFDSDDEVEKRNESDAEEAEEAEDDDDDSSPESGDARSCGFLDEVVQVHDDGTSGTEEEEEEEEEGDNEDEDPDVFLKTKKFNTPHAFATYLRFVYQHNMQQHCPFSDDSDDEDVPEGLQEPQSTPGLIYSSSSPVSSSPLRSSSVAFPSSPLFHSPRRRGSSSISFFAPSSMPPRLSLPAFTPAPPQPAWQRGRLDRVEKRMEKHKKTEWICIKDEQVEDTVDQLEEDLNQPIPPPRGNWRTKLKRRSERDHIPLPPLWVRPKLAPGEIWDPFGDEIEV
ncbi:hypothetical protein H0H92_014325 [Tricholoma furcatifolium]|nr:hypothetical protein H0H92_014325 [Tricholoma furcatifolium]